MSRRIATLRFDRVTKRFRGGTTALDAVSFDVPEGQFCAVIGPSGAGKSTLLRMVNGLAEPSEGYVEIGGMRVCARNLSALRRDTGMIHQHFSLTPRANVATNVVAGALPAISTWRALTGLFPDHFRKKACALIAAVGLDETHLRRRAETLSGGQQQRVGIARAFMLDPSIILADEPVASLDPRLSGDILALLKREASTRGSTVLCTLHQIDLAKRFADRIVALRDGRIVFDGPPAALDDSVIDALYERPAVPGATETVAPVTAEAA